MRVKIEGRGTTTTGQGSTSVMCDYQEVTFQGAVNCRAEVMVSIGENMYWITEGADGAVTIRGEGSLTDLVVYPESANAVTVKGMRR